MSLHRIVQTQEGKNGFQTGNISSWRGALYGHQFVGPGGELVHYRTREGRRYEFFCSRGRCGLSTCDQGCRVADGSVLLAAEQWFSKRIGDRINAMYLDKLDGRVDSTFFDKTSAGWREEQNRCLREM